MRGVFGDVVSEIDWGVGEIVKALKKYSLDKNTLIIFTSDNGPWLAYGDHAGSAGPLREGKGTAFEGGLRVPSIMWWPGKINPGTESSEIASTIDILPTICHLSGAKLPKMKIDGKNIWPLMTGKSHKSPHEAFYYYSGKNLSAVRSGKWKLMFPQGYRTILVPGKGGRPGKSEQRKIELSLFDLESDVGETKNVIQDHPEVVSKLQKLANQIREELGDGKDIIGKEIRPVGK